MIKVGIIGATGYTGSELLRLLVRHPQAQIEAVTSRTEQGKAVADLFPHLRGYIDLDFTDPGRAPLQGCDVVFFATPNGTAMKEAGSLLAKGIKIIDLSADFRLRDATAWSKWYGETHVAPELLQQAVYGLPELNRESIQKTSLVANPGCYPTSIILALLPVLEAGCIDPGSIIADAKSGVSGAGRKASITHLYSEASESFKAYGASGHRHYPEISQVLGNIAKAPVGLTFVPHLVPMIRGIHATVYVRLKDPTFDLQGLYTKRYRAEPFVDVMPEGAHPDTRTVRGNNMCRIALHKPATGDTAVILSVIDNLVKGAAGQAIQNMNLMIGFPETAGLDFAALAP